MFHSNLGGFGPDVNGSQTMRLNNVGLSDDGRRIDMLISNLTAYQEYGTAHNEWRYNGLSTKSNGTFGVVAVQTPPVGQPTNVSRLLLRFTLLDAGPNGRDEATAQPLTIGRTHFSFCESTWRPNSLCPIVPSFDTARAARR